MVQMIMANRLYETAQAALTHAMGALGVARKRLSPEIVMDAVRLIAGHHAGQVVTTGVGKSALVAQRIAATLRVVGVRAWFLHPLEALHGDLGGMNTAEDVLLVCSRSGESEELRGLLDYAKEWVVPVIAITSGEGSMLARAAQVILSHGGEEACPFNLTPTSSVTAAGALGDALAMALQSYLGFSAKNFQDLHGNGTLGRRLTLKVKDVMVTWPHYIGIVRPDDSILEGMMTLARKRGTLVVIDSGETEKFLGVVTAGDVARFLDTEFRPVSSHPAAGRKEWLDLPLSTIMTRDPHVIAPGVLVVAAIELMQMEGVMALPVLDDGCVMGMIHLHDALRARVQ